MWADQTAMGTWGELGEVCQCRHKDHAYVLDRACDDVWERSLPRLEVTIQCASEGTALGWCKPPVWVQVSPLEVTEDDCIVNVMPCSHNTHWHWPHKMRVHGTLMQLHRAMQTKSVNSSLSRQAWVNTPVAQTLLGVVDILLKKGCTQTITCIGHLVGTRLYPNSWHQLQWNIPHGKVDIDMHHAGLAASITGGQSDGFKSYLNTELTDREGHGTGNTIVLVRGTLGYSTVWHLYLWTYCTPG